LRIRKIRLKSTHSLACNLLFDVRIRARWWSLRSNLALDVTA